MIKFQGLNAIKRHIALAMFVILYITLAMLTHKDFGITWDEFVDYDKGVVSYQFFFKKKVEKPFILNKKNGHLDIKGVSDSYSSFEHYLNITQTEFKNHQYYSGFYPMILFLLNKDKSIETYHLLNMLFSLTIFIALYALLYHHYKDQKIAILGPIFLFLTPRFLGHIPGNSKDIPFAVMYFISCTAIYFFASSKKILAKILVVGILFGLTQDLRIAAITLYIILILFDGYIYLLEKHNNPDDSETWGQILTKEIQTVILIGIVALLVSVLTWPYLGINVIPNIKELLKIGTDFPWKHTVVYQGKELQGKELPGHYLVTWFAIATPLIILIPSLLSPLVIKKRFQNRLFILLLLGIVTNMTIYAILKPLIYDGLRHFLFLVPFVSALGVMALVELFKNTQRKLIRVAFVVIILINVAVIIRQIGILHPYQYIFFNSLVGGLQGAYGKYDTEYWGASYHEAINWFKKNIATDPKKMYRIHIWQIGRYKIYQADNIINVPIERAEYIFRFTRRMKEEPRKEDVIHVVQRNNTPLVFIEKNKNFSSPFTMEWDEEALEILKKVPERLFDFVVQHAETFAQARGYAKVSVESLAEQMGKKKEEF